MEKKFNEQERYLRAQKKVEEIKGFYSHLGIYIIFNGILLFINLKYSPEVLWFYWTTLGWGVGVLVHALKVFNYLPFFDKDWEDKKIKEFMDEENKKQKWE